MRGRRAERQFAIRVKVQPIPFVVVPLNVTSTVLGVAAGLPRGPVIVA